jgi:hypothetical protein
MFVSDFDRKQMADITRRQKILPATGLAAVEATTDLNVEIIIALMNNIAPLFLQRVRVIFA